MSRLISFGDSFTFGNDLKDCNGEIPSQLTWPSLLAKHLNLTYECLAEPGCSNSSIFRKVLSAKIQPSDLVVINWTWIDRWDFYNHDHWETLRPSGTETSDFYKIYYKYFQSELWDKIETLKNIHSIFSLLNNFISTTIDPLTVDKQWHCPIYVDRLIDVIQPNLKWFDGKGFYHWSKENKYPISDLWHPLEEAHQAAFEYIINNYEFT